MKKEIKKIIEEAEKTSPEEAIQDLNKILIELKGGLK